MSLAIHILGLAPFHDWEGKIPADLKAQLQKAGLPAVWPGTLSKLPPLSIGEHFIVVYWVFDAVHCAGIDAVIEQNCLGPGKVPRIGLSFEVTPSSVQSH